LGILPLEFSDISDYDKIDQGDIVRFKNLKKDVENRNDVRVIVEKSNGKTEEFMTKHTLSDRQINILIKGGIINDFKEKLDEKGLKA